MTAGSSIMRLADPLPLDNSWPLFERDARFDLGIVHDQQVESPDRAVPVEGIGRWQCDLHDNALQWSPAVYDIFGLPRGAMLHRDDTVALYSEASRAAMERLRAYAIRHLRGFTLDTEICPAQGPSRWMRLTAAPVCDGKRAVRLEGWKQDVTATYR